MQEQVLEFWFQVLPPEQWWAKDPELDSLIEYKFANLHIQAEQGELYTWRSEPKGALAEIIILDQFSRNIYRDTPRAFASDAQALTLSQVAISQGLDQHLSQDERLFLYLPYMHSESAMIHEIAVGLFTELGLPSNLDFEYKHKAIIERFGRYPHRNDILGRPSTDAEVEFLKQPNAGF